MCQTYSIIQGTGQVGVATVHQEGLYAYIRCHCPLKDNNLYRIEIIQDGVVIDLGTCLKDKDGYRINTKIPRKRLAETPRFYLMKKGGEINNFYPLIPGKAFELLHQIRKGVLVCRDNVTGVFIPRSDQQDSDQNPEYLYK